MEKLEERIEKLNMTKNVLEQQIKSAGHTLELGYKDIEEINEAISNTLKIKKRANDNTEKAKLELAIKEQELKNKTKKILNCQDKLQIIEKKHIEYIKTLDKRVSRLKEQYNIILEDIGKLKHAQKDIDKKNKELKEIEKLVNNTNKELSKGLDIALKEKLNFDKIRNNNEEEIKTQLKEIESLNKIKEDLNTKIKMMQKADKYRIENENKREKELQEKERELTIIYGRLRTLSKELFNSDLKL